MRRVGILLALASLCIARDPMCPYPSMEATYFPNRQNCSQFFECFAGDKYEMQCFPGLYWNQPKKICNHECDFGDGSTLPPRPTNPTPPSPPGPTTPPAPGPTPIYNICVAQPDKSLHPDPADCKSYYECVNGTPIHIHCPNGEYFDRAALDCLTGDC